MRKFFLLLSRLFGRKQPQPTVFAASGDWVTPTATYYVVARGFGDGPGSGSGGGGLRGAAAYPRVPES